MAETMDLRVQSRKNAGYDAELIWKTPSGEKRFEDCRTVDSSDGGVGVECPAELPVCSAIILRSESANLAALSQVRHCTWKRSTYLLGLQFLAKTTAVHSDPGEPDHYEILRLSQTADEESIARVYRTLARRFHPDNGETGDAQAFLRVNQAWRILSDPQKRARYDADRLQMNSGPRFGFQSREFYEGLRGEQNRRIAILCLLYRKRSINYQNPGVSMLELERLTGFTREEIGFAIWYLREKKMAVAADNSQYSIGSDGVDYLEASQGPPELLAIAAPSLSAGGGASSFPQSDPAYWRSR